jgi:hypothetical protein
MKRLLLTLIAVLALTLAGCGDDETDVATPAAGGDDAPTAEPVCIGAEEERPMRDYVGLTEQEATDRAADEGYSIRVVGADGECFAITLDLRDDRVNVELADGVVIAAAIF